MSWNSLSRHIVCQDYRDYMITFENLIINNAINFLDVPEMTKCLWYVAKINRPVLITRNVLGLFRHGT